MSMVLWANSVRILKKEKEMRKIEIERVKRQKKRFVFICDLMLMDTRRTSNASVRLCEKNICACVYGCSYLKSSEKENYSKKCSPFQKGEERICEKW